MPKKPPKKAMPKPPSFVKPLKTSGLAVIVSAFHSGIMSGIDDEAMVKMPGGQMDSDDPDNFVSMLREFDQEVAGGLQLELIASVPVVVFTRVNKIGSFIDHPTPRDVVNLRLFWLMRETTGAMPTSKSKELTDIRYRELHPYRDSRQMRPVLSEGLTQFMQRGKLPAPPSLTATAPDFPTLVRILQAFKVHPEEIHRITGL